MLHRSISNDILAFNFLINYDKFTRTQGEGPYQSGLRCTFI